MFIILWSGGAHGLGFFLSCCYAIFFFSHVFLNMGESLEVSAHQKFWWHLHENTHTSEKELTFGPGTCILQTWWQIRQIKMQKNHGLHIASSVWLQGGWGLFHRSCMDTSDQIIYILVTQQGWAYCRQGTWTKREVFCDCFLWILHGRFWLDGRAESNKLYLVSLLRDIHDLSDVQTVGWIHVQKRLNPGQRQKGKREGLYQEEERAVGCL